jgi:preprotein translocase subunit SecG
MLKTYNLLSSGAMQYYTEYSIVGYILLALMAITAIATVILVLMQPTNSSGIDALGGSSETFFGKNKGRSIEAKMKKWTWICLAVLVVLSLVFFLLPVIFA